MPTEPARAAREGLTKTIARTVAEAAAGDLIWYCDPQRSRYDGNGKYEGRGTWELRPVQAVGRLSIELRHGKFARDTGALRGDRSGLSGLPFVAGSAERTDRWWSGQSYAIARSVERCTDRETLRTIAFALGLDGPPDFSVDPDDAGRRALQEAARHG